MAGKRGMIMGGAGITKTELANSLDKQYADFCHYRQELYTKMPDFRTVLFSKRVFNGETFDL